MFNEGKHYFKLEGEILKEFKSLVENFDLPINKFTHVLYLWTKYGAARHAKMLSTDKAWEVFEKLEEAYFESKEKTSSAPKVENEVAVEKPVEVQNPVAVQDKPFPKYHEIIADIDKSATLLNKCLGFDYELSFVTVAATMEDNHGLNLTRIKNLLPAAKRGVTYFNATQIGEFVAKKKNLKKFSAQQVNKILIERGLQKKDSEGNYILTEEGKEYGGVMPFNSNGHNGDQIKWAYKVLNFFDNI